MPMILLLTYVLRAAAWLAALATFGYIVSVAISKNPAGFFGVILVRSDVRDVVASIRLSRATMRTIKQNLFWAFIYNAVGVSVMP